MSLFYILTCSCTAVHVCLHWLSINILITDIYVFIAYGDKINLIFLFFPNSKINDYKSQQGFDINMASYLHKAIFQYSENYIFFNVNIIKYNVVSNISNYTKWHKISIKHIQLAINDLNNVVSSYNT